MNMRFQLIGSFHVGFLASGYNLTIPLTTLPLSPNLFFRLAAAANRRVSNRFDRPPSSTLGVFIFKIKRYD
jgi:hypothetical protein